MVVWHESSIKTIDRERLNGHRGGVIWFTGLSGSGKSTVANKVDEILFGKRRHSVLLDGDNVRHGLCATVNQLQREYSSEFAQRFGLGFGADDRQENIRRVGTACELIMSAGIIVLTAFVSPYRADRDRIRKSVEDRHGAGRFFEIFVDVPLEICESRDPKGLYKKARAGEIKNFTGISDPYETPDNPDLVLKNSDQSAELAAQTVVETLERRDWFRV